MKRIILLVFFTFTLCLHAQRNDFNEINFQKADRIADRYKGEELTNLPVLALRLTAQLETDVERFRAIYIWVTHNVRGDYHLTSTNSHMHRKLKNNPEELHQWNKQFKKEIFQQLKDEKKTLCTGYAYLIKELANLAGLECEIVHGYGQVKNIKFDNMEFPNHSWNAIKLNNKWYLCDATWSSGIIDMSNYSFEFSYEDSFFLMEPSIFAKSHRPIDAQWSLFNENAEN